MAGLKNGCGRPSGFGHRKGKGVNMTGKQTDAAGSTAPNAAGAGSEQQLPEHVQAWQIALGCEVFGPNGLWLYRPVTGPVRIIPNRDSPEYAWGLVRAADYFCILKGDYGNGNRCLIRWNEGYGRGPDKLSALIAAVLASKGEKV